MRPLPILSTSRLTFQKAFDRLTHHSTGGMVVLLSCLIQGVFYLVTQIFPVRSTNVTFHPYILSAQPYLQELSPPALWLPGAIMA